MSAFPRLVWRAALLPMILALRLAPAGAGEPSGNPCLGFTHIKTFADLNNIRKNLSGKYCLDNDLDLSRVRNFTPIGSIAVPFSGQFNGQGHIIRNLKITSSSDLVGLFANISGSAFNLALVNANVTATGSTGKAGIMAGALTTLGSVTNSRSSGSVRNTAGTYGLGGLVGVVTLRANVTNSWSSAAVTGLDDTLVGGLVGQNSGLVRKSFATGAVTCGKGCSAGGLVGLVQPNLTDGAGGLVQQSFATGRVKVTTNFSSVGGLVGHSNGKIQQSYAVGPVFGGFNASTGGLVGVIDGVSSALPGSVSQSYAAGQNRSGVFTFSGGLVGVRQNAFVTDSYWDKSTTGQSSSHGGTGKTTAQLRAALPSGFVAPPWAITKGESYPFLAAGFPAFDAALATTVVSNNVFTFLPIGQHERSEYLTLPAHADAASLAAVYTMIARAIGITDQVALLDNVKVDKYFWHDATQTTTFTGPVTSHATLSRLASIGSNVPLGTANVIGTLNLHKVVILRGTYTKSGGGSANHSMLATLYTKNSNGSVSAVVADDPWTGRQVTINPTTKKVLSPANFPLSNFTVDAYQTVSLH